MFNEIRNKINEDIKLFDEIISRYTEEDKITEINTYNYWLGRKSYAEELLKYLF